MSLWAFSVRRWQFTLVVFALLIATGLWALSAIPRAEDPTLKFPGSLVVVHFPGADPEDVERLVVDPIEDALAELEDVKRLNSSAQDGLALIEIEFTYGSDPDRKYDEVIREVNAARGRLPADVFSIEVRQFTPGTVNIVQLALVSPDADWRALRKHAEDLEELIETAPGVRRADTWAYPDPEVRVAIDLERLAAARVTLGQVIAAVQGENASIPGGAVDVGLRRYNLKTSGSYRSLGQVADTVVAAAGSRVVRLRDVAEVGWSAGEERYTGRFNGTRAVFVTASMKDNQNVFDVRDAIYARLPQFEQGLPANVRLERGFDQSRNVDRRLSRLQFDFTIAITLVILTLLPLGLRAAGIVMISIPLSLAIGLALIYLFGFSLNQLSIAGFVVALGLLVDDSIVVVENIARHVRQGMPRLQAAIAATDQIWLAVLGCTVTLLLAFVPLLFLPEGAGDFVRSLPAAVLFTILASFFVALSIIPFLASRLLRGGTPREPRQPWLAALLARGRRVVDRSDEVADTVLGRLMDAIHRFYGPALRFGLARPKRTLAAALGIFALSLALVPLIGFSLFPTADIPQFRVRIEAPDGASLAETDRALTFVEERLAAAEGVRWWFSNLGQENPRIYYNVLSRQSAANIAEVFAEIEDYSAAKAARLLDGLRAEFADYPAARISVHQFENGPPVAAPIEIRVIGPDLGTLRLLAADVERLIAAVPGTRDVMNPMRLQRTDLDLGIDTEKAALFGVPAIEADRTVRLAVAGLSAGRFREPDGDEYDIMLRLPIGARPTLDLLQSVQVSSVAGRQVPLAQITDPRFRSAPSVIKRYNRERAVSVTAWPATGHATDELTRQVLSKLDAMAWPPGYRWVAAGEIEAREESFSGLGVAMLVAVFGILAVLVLEFGSFRSMLIVFGVVPLGITGALVALWLTGYTLSFTSLIGMIALVGIEIKNSILLVDFTNRLRGQGKALDDAIAEAGEVRFLPILLTSLTAIGGLTPLAIQGSGLYSPLAIVIIGGLISSTLLARLVTPVMYKLLPPAIDKGDASNYAARPALAASARTG
ncbi:MAG: efflux RND transporter permease subunit [Steroidobacteraceae bacterium]|nr:efflux RND transporter permease subunit [Steroidobacteraceae bacterium]